MNIERLYSVTKSNRLTITANNESARFKFAQGNTLEENIAVEALFKYVAYCMEPQEITYRGHISTEFVRTGNSFSLHNDARTLSLTFEIPPVSILEGNHADQ